MTNFKFSFTNQIFLKYNLLQRCFVIYLEKQFQPGNVTYSEAFSHVKISSTRLIAHLKAREKLSFTLLVADFRGFA